MSESPSNQELITDYLLGRLDPEAREAVARRIEAEPELKRLHDDLRNTFAVLGLAIEAEPPADLVQRTMDRIRTAKQTDALLAREQLARRDVIRPTFSVREVAAAACILLICGVIFSVAYQDVNRRAMQDRCQANVMRVGTALTSFANRNDGLMPMAEAPGERWLPAENEPAASNSSALFRLLADKSIEPSTFQCPAVAGESFTYQPGMTDFPDAKFINYSYQHSLGRPISREDKRLEAVASNMAILADSSPVFCNGRFLADCVRRPAGDNHGGRGQTVLYLDMHAKFTDSPSVGVKGNNIYLAEGVYDYKGVEKPVSLTDTFLLPAWTPPTSCGGK